MVEVVSDGYASEDHSLSELAIDAPMIEGDGLSERVKILVASAGFFSDAYDLFVINLVLVIFKGIYDVTDEDKSSIATFALVGAVVGQLVFGSLGDCLGRTTAWIITISLIIVGAFGSALSYSIGALSLVAVLSFWRFVLGFAIGGEYPLSATVSSEASSKASHRGQNVALVFSSQGWGNLCAPIVMLALVGSQAPLETCWRIALAFGAVPSLLTLYHRIRLFQHHKNREQESRARHSWRWTLRCIVDNYKMLLGTGGSWFLFDVTFYSNGLFSGTILSLLHLDSDPSATTRDVVMHTAFGNVIITLMALPGYYCAIFLIDRIGRRPLQQFGFLSMSAVYLIIASAYPKLKEMRYLFIFLYGLTFFLSNMGPNTTTFVVPSECYDKSVRTTCHGISSAAGKLGAAFGTVVMPFALSYLGLEHVMYLSSAFAFLGFLVSVAPLVPETMNRPLRD